MINNSTLKYCSKCKVEKPLSEFHRNINSNDGFHSHCKECKSLRRKNDYQNNRENEIQYALEYQKENPEVKRKSDRTYYQNHSEEIKNRVKLYNKTPKGKLVHLNHIHKRRAKCKITDITTDWLEQLKENSIHCPLCGCEMNEIKNHPQEKTLEHIIPLNVGGTHTMDNVMYDCRKCNLSRPKDGSDLIEMRLVA